jgi:leucyl aminopeptidase
VELQAAERIPEGVEAIVVALHPGEEPPSDIPAVSQRRLSWADFQAKRGEQVVGSASPDGPVLVTVGLGSVNSAEDEAESIRHAAASAVRAASGVQSVALVLPGSSFDIAGPSLCGQALAEGALLGAYSYDAYKSTSKPRGPRTLVAIGGEGLGGGIARGEVIARAVSFARDLVNAPAGDMTPRHFCELAVERVASRGVLSEIWDEQRIRDERLGGLMAVAAGSKEPPRLLKLSYNPSGRPRPALAIVGKGITFDSGGLSLKTADGMMTMKTDMSGAAAVVATILALAELGVDLSVVGFAPLTENMPGGAATKPGDVFRARNGKTVEVLNTDAEGRLVLADALSLADEADPMAVVDLATLTGACVVALGRDVAGLFANSESMASKLISAGARAGEAAWRLPLYAPYREQIESEVADIKNIGAPGQAGAVIAALVLAEFVGARPWAHLDIAGPARSADDKAYLRKGGTGFGVRTLVEFASSVDEELLSSFAAEVA